MHRINTKPPGLPPSSSRKGWGYELRDTDIHNTRMLGQVYGLLQCTFLSFHTRMGYTHSLETYRVYSTFIPSPIRPILPIRKCLNINRQSDETDKGIEASPLFNCVEGGNNSHVYPVPALWQIYRKKRTVNNSDSPPLSSRAGGITGVGGWGRGEERNDIPSLSLSLFFLPMWVECEARRSTLSFIPPTIYFPTLCYVYISLWTLDCWQLTRIYDTLYT